MFPEGRVDIFDEARSGCPSTARNTDTIAEGNERIPENKRIKVRGLKTVLKGLSRTFFAEEFDKVVQRCEKCLSNGGTYVEKLWRMYLSRHI